jgi:2-polyprenyl-3-methyl-5-hydroxy-6-metoxy-1,4-benzoquinol methylase
MRKKLFIKPPLDKMPLQGQKGFGRPGLTYSHYNYLLPGISSYIKLLHFEAALRFSREYFHGCSAIDFGCADGIFLPSLSNYFKHVLAVDIRPDFVDESEKLVKNLNLNNVTVICNQNMSLSELRKSIQNKFHIIFLLETIEHIGEKNHLHESKVDFLKALFQLIEPGGHIILSMPKMVGPMFLLQRLGLSLLGSPREESNFIDLLRAGFLYNVDNLESQWKPSAHLGFNHVKLLKLVTNEFHIEKKRDIGFQVLWMLTEK